MRFVDELSVILRVYELIFNAGNSQKTGFFN